MALLPDIMNSYPIDLQSKATGDGLNKYIWKIINLYVSGWSWYFCLAQAQTFDQRAVKSPFSMLPVPGVIDTIGTGWKSWAMAKAKMKMIILHNYQFVW
jgi:hypothetical protein